jgi:ferredoxin
MRRGLAILVLLTASAVARGVERFPPPDFSEHKLPVTATPMPQRSGVSWVDVALLAGALGAASFLALRRRSRRGLVVLSLAALGYFGFYRAGCICPVGAIQNVSAGLAGTDVVLPLQLLVYVLLPLAAALVVGRVFCGAACPLGAIQDLLLIKSLRVPAWLSEPLGMLPFAYLLTASALAAIGGQFIVCRLDPFVGLFRAGHAAALAVLQASWPLTHQPTPAWLVNVPSAELSGAVIIGGLVLLAVGTVIARPYCRFLCPYGAILRPLSEIAYKHCTITPDECVRCRLCEKACPVDAIQPSTPELPPSARLIGKASLAFVLVMLPVLVIAMAWSAGQFAPALADLHPVVHQARVVAAGPANSLEQQAMFQVALTLPQLQEQAAAIQLRLQRAMVVAGAIFGLVLWVRLLVRSVRRRRQDFTIDKASCVSCGRCFRYCPVEIQRLKRLGREP